MLIAFKWKNSAGKVDETGFNTVGYVTNSGMVVFQNRRRIIQRKFSEIKTLPHQTFKISESFDLEKIDKFFTENFQTPELFHHGLASITQGGVTYFDSPIKLPKLENSEPQSEIRTKAWGYLKNEIQIGDVLFTFDTKSFTSKVITWVDNGPWSHCGICTGNGTIVEATTSGMVERPIDVYADTRYRVGLYKVLSEGDQPEKRIEFSRAQLGKPYNFRGAFVAGLRKLMNRPRTPTPNDLATSPMLQLVALV